jgi:hypothetical protein
MKSGNFLKSKRLVVIDKPFCTVVLKLCLAHDVRRKLFHHQVCTVFVFMTSNIERNFIYTNQFAGILNPYVRILIHKAV